MCVVKTTSVWVAVVPMRFFILCDRLKPEGADSPAVFICGNFHKMLNNNLLEAVSAVTTFCVIIDWRDQFPSFKAWGNLWTG